MSFEVVLLVGFVTVCLLFGEVGFHHVAQIGPRCLLLLLSEGVFVLAVSPVLCTYMCIRCACVMCVCHALTWRLEDSFVELVLFYLLWSSDDWSQDVSLPWQVMLSHFVGSTLRFCVSVLSSF